MTGGTDDDANEENHQGAQAANSALEAAAETALRYADQKPLYRALTRQWSALDVEESKESKDATRTSNKEKLQRAARKLAVLRAWVGKERFEVTATRRAEM